MADAVGDVDWERPARAVAVERARLGCGATSNSLRTALIGRLSGRSPCGGRVRQALGSAGAETSSEVAPGACSAGLCAIQPGADVFSADAPARLEES